MKKKIYISLLLSSLSFLSGRYYREKITADTREEIACRLEQGSCDRISSSCQKTSLGKKPCTEDKRFSLEYQSSLPLAHRWRDLGEVLCFWIKNDCDTLEELGYCYEANTEDVSYLDSEAFLACFFSPENCQTRKEILSQLKEEVSKAERVNEYLYQTLMTGKREGFLLSSEIQKNLFARKAFFDRLVYTKNRYEELLFFEKKLHEIRRSFAYRQKEDEKERCESSPYSHLQNVFEENKQSFFALCIESFETLSSLILQYPLLQLKEERITAEEEMKKVELMLYRVLEIYLAL